MKIYVKVLKGSECEVEIPQEANVQDVKVKLQAQVSIPTDQQKLIYQGKALSDDKPLGYYKIADGSKLFLMLKKPGGGMTPASCSTPGQSSWKTPDAGKDAVEEEMFQITYDPTGFWNKLSAFLKRHFTERDAAKVLKEFKKDFDKGLNSLSLDDIERLATNRLNPTQSQFQPMAS